MTKEEIIEECKQRLGFETDCEMYSLCQHEKDFYNAIIKALEQQPSEDCVSRAKALSAIRNLYPSAPFVRLNYKKWHEENKKYFECEDIIKALPPVTPTRNKGEWCKQNDDYFDWYECSECGYGSEGEMQYSSECDVRTKFCPNCGAEMEGNNEIN